MNPSTSDLLADHLRPALPGMFFAVLTLLFGFSLGIAFGVNEDAIQTHLKASATAVRDTVYRGNDAAMKTVQERSWVYLQRAHLHAGGIGAASIGLILLLVRLGDRPSVTRIVSLALGVGTLGYPIYWMWAALRAPGLGSTGAAKESLKWLAMPSSGLVVLATFAIVVLVAAAALRQRPNPSG
ncbi:MAG: hypothetical protein EXS38_02170 [Opitutus sp.]|nr:hypothetical protein [Opitutus sp.]